MSLAPSHTLFARTFRSVRDNTPPAFEIPASPGAEYVIEAARVGRGPWVGAVALANLTTAKDVAVFVANGRVQLPLAAGIYQWRLLETDSRQIFNVAVRELIQVQ
jgi:hypothetical protein